MRTETLNKLTVIFTTDTAVSTTASDFTPRVTSTEYTTVSLP